MSSTTTTSSPPALSQFHVSPRVAIRRIDKLKAARKAEARGSFRFLFVMRRRVAVDLEFCAASIHHRHKRTPSRSDRSN